MDWHVDASIPLGQYSVQDRASNEPSRSLKLHNHVGLLLVESTYAAAKIVKPYLVGVFYVIVIFSRTFV